jgi:F-type H+-transporting ATPase subunit alpha
VSILFAGARGLLDDIPVEKIREFEKGFHQYMGSTGKAVLAELAQKKEIDDALEEALKKAVLDYKRGSGLAEKKEGAEEAAGEPEAAEDEPVAEATD